MSTITRRGPVQALRAIGMVVGLAIAASVLLPAAPSQAAHSLRLSVTSGAPGSTVSASAAGFPRRSAGTVSFQGVAPRSLRTTTRGAFKLTLTVPPGPDGRVTVTAVVAGTKASAVFTRKSAAPAPSTQPAPFGPTAGRPFASNSAWNTPIPANPVPDAASAAQVAYLSQGAHPGVANLYAYGVPIWEADASTPRYPVKCVKTWGTCGLQRETVPVPDGASATPVSNDGAMVVVDHSTGRSYEFYEGERVGGTWQAGWGGVLSTTGNGVGTWDNSATGSAVSRLAGVVRAREIAAGAIEHALVFSTNNACKRTYRYPAAKTDGTSTRTDCIPEGARIQLDPSINLDAIPMTRGERIVARALQTYGAYAIDNGGAKMAFIFEVPSGEADPYRAAGFTGDYFGMDRIPWAKLRVLRTATGK